VIKVCRVQQARQAQLARPRQLVPSVRQDQSVLLALLVLPVLLVRMVRWVLRGLLVLRVRLV
jgi:hypothetical protein